MSFLARLTVRQRLRRLRRLARHFLEGYARVLCVYDFRDREAVLEIPRAALYKRRGKAALRLCRRYSRLLS